MPKDCAMYGRYGQQAPRGNNPNQGGGGRWQRSYPWRYTNNVNAYNGRAANEDAKAGVKCEIPNRPEYEPLPSTTQKPPSPTYPPSLFDIITTQDQEREKERKKQKDMAKSLMKSLATFVVQARHEQSDLDLLRDALLDIADEKGGYSSKIANEDFFNSLVKRIENCETRLPDASVMERLSSLEQRINLDSSLYLSRIERLESQILEIGSANNAASSSGKISKTDEKLGVQSRKQWNVKACTSSLFPIPAMETESIGESNTFLNSHNQKALPSFASTEEHDSNANVHSSSPDGNNLDSMADRIASVIGSKLTSDNVLLKRLESLESNMKAHMSAFTEKMISPRKEPRTPLRSESSSSSCSTSFSTPTRVDSTVQSMAQVEEIEIKDEPEEIPMKEMNFIVDPDDFVIVHTDGVGNLKSNTRGNPGVRVWFGHNHHLNVSRPIEAETSNKAAQLFATYYALSQCNNFGLTQVRLYTSSHYIMRIFHKLDSWNKRDWMRNKEAQLRLKHADKFEAIHRFLKIIKADFRQLTDENCARSMDISLKVKIKDEDDPSTPVQPQATTASQLTRRW